jgi:hypothetical protein
MGKRGAFNFRVRSDFGLRDSTGRSTVEVHPTGLSIHEVNAASLSKH